MKQFDLYLIDRAALKEAVQVRRVFDKLAEVNDQREVERLKFCLEHVNSEATVIIPPVPKPIWKCVVEPSPYSGNMVLTYKFVTAIRQFGAVEYNRLFVDNGPISGELICIKIAEEKQLQDLLGGQQPLSSFEQDVVSKAVRSPRFLAN